MTYFEESQKAGRHIFPDLVRAFAIIGIVLVNVAVIAYPMMTGYLDGGLKTSADHLAHFVVNSVFALKSYTLFSFMFGVGFAYQMVSAQRKGIGFGARYSRRIIGLLAFGLLHVAFIFQGDILVLYAILGSLLFLFRKAQARTLVIWGGSFYIIQCLLIGLLALAMVMGFEYAPEEMAKEVLKAEEAAAFSRAVYGGEGFGSAMALRLQEWSQVLTFGTLMQGFGVFAFFLFGLAAVRSDVIRRPDAPLWRRFRRLCLPIGLIGSAIGAYILGQGQSMMAPNMMIGMAVLTLASPFSTAGYLGVIAKWAAGKPGALKTFMARGGTATLTAYLMQGLLLSLIFNAYGLSLFGQLGAVYCILIALGVGLFTLGFSSIWRLYFTRGPLEAILRAWTYWGRA